MRPIHAQQLTGPIAFHAEGPVWLGTALGLRWVDQLAGEVLSLRADNRIERSKVGDVAAMVRPRRRGGTVTAIERTLVLDDGADTPAHKLPELWSDPSVRFNDGGCDPDGRLYVGTMAYDERPGRGKLYRFEADHSSSIVLDNLTVSNGLAWSPDGRRAYYVDSATRGVDCFDYQPGGALTNRRTLVSISMQDGIPDGLTVDAEGGIWVALWGGSAVHRYDPSGEISATVTLPVSNATACTFGGADLDELYVTTSALGLKTGSEAMAGSLFRCQPGVKGLPALEYAG